MSRPRSNAALLLSLMLSGCVPAMTTEAPPISGSVRSSTTKMPLAGVTLSYKDFPEVTTRTQVDGSYALPEIRHFTVELLGTDRSPATVLILTAIGYKPTSAAIYPGGPEHYDFVLEPAQAVPNPSFQRTAPRPLN